MNKSVLIIAGSGFLGQAIFKALKQNNFGRLGCIDIADPKIFDVKFYHLNILSCTQESLLEVFSSYDVIINCSGQITNPINTCYRLNSEGIDKISSAVKVSNKYLMHFSTIAVFGSCDRADEQSPLNPETPYSASKAFAEFTITNTLNPEQFCILRLSNLYGDGQPKGVFSYLKRSFNSDKKLEFNNDGSMLRYYLHVDDCAKIAIQAVKSLTTGIFNLIGPEAHTLKELVALAEDISGRKFDATYNAIAPWDNTLIISDAKLKAQMDVTYFKTLKQSLELILRAP